MRADVAAENKPAYSTEDVEVGIRIEVVVMITHKDQRGVCLVVILLDEITVIHL